MKDYKKILEGVVDIINATEKSDIGFANICTYIGENCPEIEESEDERIRKALIHLVNSNKELSFGIDNYDGIKWSDILAWLEKQGEHKAIELNERYIAEVFEKVGLAKMVRELENDNLTNALQDAMLKLSKEQKPADKVEQKGMNLDEENMTPFQKKVFCIIDTTIEEEQGLKQVCDELLRLAHDEIMQKPAWSEEDEDVLEDVEEAIINYWNGQSQEDLLDWLKNLEDRVQLQPKQEWSEEDKKKLTRIYMLLAEAADEHAFSTTCRLIGDKECVDLQDFLKSLKDRVQPQSQWKPSDEQMEMVDKIINALSQMQLFGGRNALIDLKHDLEKLREEDV